MKIDTERRAIRILEYYLGITSAEHFKTVLGIGGAEKEEAILESNELGS